MSAAHSATIPSGVIAATADTLETMSREIEQLGGDLCSSPALAEQFLDQLQAIDRFSQTLSQLAHVLRAPEPGAAINAVCMDELRAQLQRAHGADA